MNIYSRFNEESLELQTIIWWCILQTSCLTASQSVNSHRSVRVEHNSESLAHSSGRKILGELSSNETVVAVRLHDLAPNSSEFSVVFNTLGLVNVSDSLAEVKAGVLLIIHTLHLEEGELLRLSALASLETNESGFVVESIIYIEHIRASYLTG